jgi:glycerate 2-kinase
VSDDRPPRSSGSQGRPHCFISSGETTVRVRGSGRGGRNQEFALALVDRLSRAQRSVVVASVGTDGVDGPTDAAGALVSSDSLARAFALNLVPASFLADNNAYAFFDALGDLMKTGPTGTNVGDLQVCVVDV